jgi:predicted cupin superfamily sugar epimerase
MDSRGAALISSLGLMPHPEGGYFREVYRSASRVQPADERLHRAALTTIYFLLTAEDVSRWHRVASGEVWHFYEGAPLELFAADSRFDRIARHLLRPPADSGSPVHVVPADVWQAARSTGAYTLVGCTVGPGFDFADLQMLRDRGSEAETLKRRHPAMAAFL